MQSAITDALVNDLLDQAHAFTEGAVAMLDANLEDILNDMRNEPGLESRMEEAEAYAAEIRHVAGDAFEQAAATAELGAAGAAARVAIAGIRTRLQTQLANAMTPDEVDAILSAAEGDALMLTNQMDARLLEVQEEHQLHEGEGNGKPSEAALLAKSLKTAVDKDIASIRGQATSYADARKAGIEQDAAGAAQALFDATKERAT